MLRAGVLGAGVLKAVVSLVSMLLNLNEFRDLRDFRDFRLAETLCGNATAPPWGPLSGAQDAQTEVLSASFFHGVLPAVPESRAHGP